MKRNPPCDDTNNAPDVAGIAHDMRTPLSVLKTFVENVAVAGDDDEMQGLKEAARRSLEKVLKLVEELRRSAAACRIGPRCHDVADTIRQSAASVVPYARERGVDVAYVGPKRITGIADADMMDRTVTNMLVNAVEASATGQSVRVELSATSDGALFVGVVDSGCGMEESQLQDVFDRGYTHGKPGGTGIGLDVCRQMAEGHGGTLSVFSRKGCGSAFTLSLPYASPISAEAHPCFWNTGCEDTVDCY